ncbi:MAG: 2'-5' RNA ligase family protein [Acidobacteriia bacterium]|nr:2'-5' RNA ligase family protein [Terriglobia bacterium]
MMQAARYALVAYVRNPVGEFVENLRRQLHPELPHLAAHVTILPPRPLQASEFSALETLEDICGQASPFEIVLSGVETFVPVTPTVFIRVEHAAYRMRELHDKLNTAALANVEEWPYMPHLTIVKMSTEAQAEEAFVVARDLWARYQGSRRIEVKELTFVREEEPNRWKDLAGVTLGRSLVSPHDR